MKAETVVKPLVKFHSFVEFSPVAVEGKRAAILQGVEKHPVLGDQWRIRTSAVLEVDNEESPNVLHTLNAVYVRKEQSDGQ